MTNSPQTSQTFQAHADYQHDAGLAQTIRLLARLGRERFFGKLTISFEAGNIVTLRKEQTFKPNELGS
jgi:hypothetical protein